jgi:hypothetical protein
MQTMMTNNVVNIIRLSLRPAAKAPTINNQSPPGLNRAIAAAPSSKISDLLGTGVRRIALFARDMKCRRVLNLHILSTRSAVAQLWPHRRGNSTKSLRQ